MTDDWDWSDPDSLAPKLDTFNESLATCQKLVPMPLAPPYAGPQLRELGINGIEFAAWRTVHPHGLGSDLVPLRARETTTTPGTLFEVDGEAHFMQLDVGDPLPFADASVDWVYAEHLIEHVSVPVAVRWLTEVRRILAPGGVLRLTTPDLRRYVEAYVGDGALFATQRRRMRTVGLGPPMPDRPAFMFNQLFYLYGHRWIYDLDELRHVLGQAGFAPDTVRPCPFREGHPEVAHLDRVLRKHESMYVEVSV